MVMSGTTFVCRTIVMAVPIIMMGITMRLLQVSGHVTVLSRTFVIIAVTGTMPHSHKNPRENAESQK